MREILFRGKRVDNNQWTEGFLSFIYTDGRNSNGFIYTDKAQIYSPVEVRSHDVYTATVGQYTGLCDKNWVTKIFEGDIIRLDGTIGGNIYEEKELLKDTTNLIIKGVGTSSWATTEQEAIMRGCHYAE